MIIHIPAKELEEPWCSQPNKLENIYNTSICFWQQTITTHDKTEQDNLGWYVEKLLVSLSTYGIKLDNRFNTYELSVSQDGLTITIPPNNKGDTDE